MPEAEPLKSPCDSLERSAASGAGAPRADERAAFALGQRRWQEVNLDIARFAAYARDAGLVADGDGAGDALLAYACAQGVASALSLFEVHMVPVAARAIARVLSSADDREEALQQLRTKLLVGPPPALARFRGRSPLRAWLRVAATRVALDELRAPRGREEPRASLADCMLASGFDPELALFLHDTRDALKRALIRSIASLAPRDRSLLRLHFEDGLSIDRLAGPTGVHRATIARRLKAMRERIAFDVMRELAARHPELEQASLASLLRAVQSQLELNFSSLFREPRESSTAAQTAGTD